jgi:hypothetical protein
MRIRKKKEWENLFEELKLLLNSLQIDYRETKRIKIKGGLCKVKGMKVIILKRDIDPEEKCETIKKELRGIDLEPIFIKEDVREFLEE